MGESRAYRYSLVAIALHWVIAFGLGFMIWLGWNMDDNEARYQLHKSIGITILLLTVARLGWRLANPPPPLPADMPTYEQLASHAAHIGFYALLLLMPLTGWLLVSTSYEFDVPTVLFGLISWPDLPFVSLLANEVGHGIVQFVHSKLAWVAIALIALHVAGALKHEIMDEQGVLKRMIPGLFGKTTPPALPTRGAVQIFGGTLALFMVVISAPLLASGIEGQATQSASPDDTDSTSKLQPNWDVDYDTSEIRFSGTHDGAPYDGVFRDWTADIQFDADQVEQAKALVSVRTGTAQASKKLYTDSLKSPEWFNISDHPIASARLDEMRRTADGSYVADLNLTIKGQTVTVPFTFTLEDTDTGTRMTGSATLSRTALNLGQESDPGADWVADEVTVNVMVNASPAG